MSGVDRGRALTSLDMLLREMLRPGVAQKLDFTKVPAIACGSSIFWGAPKFAASVSSGMKLQREATLDVHYFAEEER